MDHFVTYDSNRVVNGRHPISGVYRTLAEANADAGAGHNAIGVPVPDDNVATGWWVDPTTAIGEGNPSQFWHAGEAAQKNRIKEDVLLHCYELLDELRPSWYLKDVQQGLRNLTSNTDAARYKASYFRIVSMGAVGAAITSTANQVWTVEKCELYLESIRSLAPVGQNKTLHWFLDHDRNTWVGTTGNDGYVERIVRTSGNTAALAHVFFNAATTSPPEYGADLASASSWNATNGTLLVEIDSQRNFSELVGRRGR